MSFGVHKDFVTSATLSDVLQTNCIRICDSISDVMLRKIHISEKCQESFPLAFLSSENPMTIFEFKMWNINSYN